MNTNYIPHSLIIEMYPHMIGENYCIMISTKEGKYYTYDAITTSAIGITGKFTKN